MSEADYDEVVERLPKLGGHCVYEFGIARGREKIHSVYVGKGRTARLRGGHLGRGGRWQQKTGPYMDACQRKGYTIYVRFKLCRDDKVARAAEVSILRTEWWRHSWNDEGTPWHGARAEYARRMGWTRK